jgi:plasmid stability protein
MASITIRNLDEDVKQKLKARASENGRSMEQEVRSILSDVLENDGPHMAKEQLAIYGRPRPKYGQEVYSEEDVVHYRKIAREKGFYASIRSIVDKYGPVEIELPPRVPQPFRNPFEGWEDDNS